MPFLRRELIEQHKRAYWPEHYDTPLARAMRAGEAENLTEDERWVMCQEAMVELEATGVFMAEARRIGGV